MKARVKATGDIIEISEGCSYLYAENYDKSYNLNELEFLDVKEKSLPKDEPDYWEKLKHQYAGMAMQLLIPRFERMRQDWINGEFEDGHRITKEEANIALKDHAEAAADVAKVYATALINRLKEEEK